MQIVMAGQSRQLDHLDALHAQTHALHAQSHALHTQHAQLHAQSHAQSSCVVEGQILQTNQFGGLISVPSPGLAADVRPMAAFRPTGPDENDETAAASLYSLAYRPAPEDELRGGKRQLDNEGEGVQLDTEGEGVDGEAFSTPCKRRKVLSPLSMPTHNLPPVLSTPLQAQINLSARYHLGSLPEGHEAFFAEPNELVSTPQRHINTYQGPPVSPIIARAIALAHTIGGPNNLAVAGDLVKMEVELDLQCRRDLMQQG
jgi:hypothetical protein